MEVRVVGSAVTMTVSSVAVRAAAMAAVRAAAWWGGDLTVCFVNLHFGSTVNVTHIGDAVSVPDPRPMEKRGACCPVVHVQQKVANASVGLVDSDSLAIVLC